MNILRARTDESQDVRFAVRERYPVEAAQARPPTPNRDALKDIFGKRSVSSLDFCRNYTMPTLHLISIHYLFISQSQVDGSAEASPQSTPRLRTRGHRTCAPCGRYELL